MVNEFYICELPSHLLRERGLPPFVFFWGGVFSFLHQVSGKKKNFQESECHKKIVAGSRKPSCVKWMDGKGDFQAFPNSRLGLYVAIERTIYKQMIF